MLVSSTLPIRGRSLFAAGQPSRGHPPGQTLGRPPLLEEAPTDGSPNDLEVAVHRLCDFRAGRNDANSGGTTPERCHILIGVDIVACPVWLTILAALPRYFVGAQATAAAALLHDHQPCGPIQHVDPPSRPQRGRVDREWRSLAFNDIGWPGTMLVPSPKKARACQGGSILFAPNGKTSVAQTFAVINYPLTLSTVKAHNLLTKFYREQ